MPSFRKVDKCCVVCGDKLKLNNTRDITRKQFCSESCKGTGLRNKVKLSTNIPCKECGKLFDATGTTQVFCSSRCCGKFHSKSTQYQYDRISGNWSKYFSRLVTQRGRESLTKEMLIDLLVAQEYKCAISGVGLTCNLEHGVICLTNASIDRIEAGGPYVLDNIQLVCRHVNTMKWTLSEEELLWWCKKVTDSKGGL